MRVWFQMHIGDRFKAFCLETGLTIITLGVDKHGSLVWEAGAHHHGLNRFLTLGVTEMPADEKHPETFVEDVIIGADDGLRYVSYTMNSDRIVIPRPDSNLEPYLTNLHRRLEDAWERARQITEDKLIEEYIMPHGTALPETSTAG